MNVTRDQRHNGAMPPATHAALTPGFGDPIHDSQAVFRVLLDAFARPGRIYRITVPVPAVGSVPGAASAALLALSDYMTPVWLQQPDAALAAALRFHTGAPLAATAAAATFAWVADASALPDLEAFAVGTPETPEHAATVLIRVEDFDGGAPLRFTGPGIRTEHVLAPSGLRDSFWAERAELAPLFPCGVDFYLVCADRLVGLPRTTHVERV